MSLTQVIESETGIHVACLNEAEAAAFRKDHTDDSEPDPAVANAILFLGDAGAKGGQLRVWIGHGVTAQLDEAQLATIGEASSCDGLVTSTAQALGVQDPGAEASSAAGGSVAWPLIGVLVLTGLLVGAIRWQILRKQRADWVEAPSDREGHLAAAPEDKETAHEASQGVVEGGSRAPTRRES